MDNLKNRAEKHPRKAAFRLKTPPTTRKIEALTRKVQKKPQHPLNRTDNDRKKPQESVHKQPEKTSVLFINV